MSDTTNLEKQLKKEETTVTLDDLQDEECEVDNMIIPMNMDELFNDDGTPRTSYNIKEFEKGVKEASFYAGFYTALQNACVSDEAILAILDAHIAKELMPTQIKAQKEIAMIDATKADNLSI